MTMYEETTWCDGCGVEITWGPVVADERRYCCWDCSQGIPCECGERMEIDEDRRETSTANAGYLA